LKYDTRLNKPVVPTKKIWRVINEMFTTCCKNGELTPIIKIALCRRRR
jgi:hypothetical protein